MHGTVSEEEVVSVTGGGAQKLTVRTQQYVGHKVARTRGRDARMRRTDEWDVGKRAEGITG
jgi:hypothetical protein